MDSRFKDIVIIDLDARSLVREKCTRDLIKKTLGGRGLATYLLSKHLVDNSDPLDKDNVLVFANGLLSGSDMICNSRIHVCARSPLSGYLTTSNGGGFSSEELNKCGIIALVIKGKSDKPTYINIHNDKIEILDGNMLWGLGTEETTDKLKDMHGGKTKVITIGPGGENLSGIAAIMTDIGHFAARTGAGAVMGSKNLKAIAIRSSKRSKRVGNEKSINGIKEYNDLIKKSPFFDKYNRVGSTYLVPWADSMGAGSAYNYRDVVFDGIEESAEASREDIVIKKKACFRCPIKCKAMVKLDKGRHQGKIMERPDFEPMVSLGSKCGNSDGSESIYLHNLCNELGLDSIGAGNLIAFAMDLYDRGIIDLEFTEGLKLEWGNVRSMESLIKHMAYRSSNIGDILSSGINYAIKVIGKGCGSYGNAVKGVTMTAMDPRGFKATALGYAVSARGSDFTYVYAKPEYVISKEEALKTYGTENAADRLSPEGKALMVKKCIINTAVVDSVGICKITHNSMLLDSELDVMYKIIRDVGGLDITKEELLLAGERIINMERLFCYKYGSSKDEDMLPEKFLVEPIKEGLSRGSIVELDYMLREFYSLMKWNDDGSVSDIKMRELGL